MMQPSSGRMPSLPCSAISLIIKHNSCIHEHSKDTRHIGNPAVDFAELHQQLAALYFAQAATTSRKNATEKLCNYLRRRVPLTEDNIELTLYCIDNSLHAGLKEGPS